MLDLVHLHSYQETSIALVQAQSIRTPRFGTQAFIGAFDLRSWASLPPSCTLGDFPPKFPFLYGSLDLWELSGSSPGVPSVETRWPQILVTCTFEVVMTLVAKHSSRRVTWAPYIQVRPSKLLIPDLGQPLTSIKQKACLGLWSTNCWHGPSFSHTHMGPAWFLPLPIWPSRSIALIGWTLTLALCSLMLDTQVSYPPSPPAPLFS